MTLGDNDFRVIKFLGDIKVGDNGYYLISCCSISTEPDTKARTCRHTDQFTFYLKTFYLTDQHIT